MKKVLVHVIGKQNLIYISTKFSYLCFNDMKLSFDLFTRSKEFVYREEGSSRGMVHSSLLQMCSPHPLLLYFLPNLRLKSTRSLYKGCIHRPWYKQKLLL